ncbi:TonB-dependent receptor [Niveispirillum sp.]|uniref:TonB-dependent receptor domain-containing protein n=1 Tax=Niveispirillum sp. TaxID=1917217 RepID=UPI001B5A39DF|nr:TonB-dependent receptor [Niveispirillum sp.]MBP7339742.1 TonB-dependent receptor [Niveispirillum sp.]
MFVQPVARRPVAVRRRLLAASMLAIMVGGTALADVSNKTVDFNIQPQPLAQALIAFSKQADVMVVAPADLVRGIQAPAVTGMQSGADALSTLLAGSGLAYAENADGTITLRPAEKQATAAPAVDALEEIIVVATKRSETLQNVPVSVGVVTGEQIEAKGINRAIDAALQVVGVNFQQADEARTAQISVRGIGTNAVSSGFEPSVSVMVDGEVYARTTSLTQNVADVERVEVLRGPQGTLFGRNTSAGAIHVITRQPKLNDQEGYVSLGLAEHGERTVKGAVNLPIADNSAIRLNASYSRIDGWLDNNAIDGEKLTNSESRGVRAQWLTELTPEFSVIVRADYSKSDSNGAGTVHLSTDNPNARVITLGRVPVGSDVTTTAADIYQYSDVENYGAGLEATLALGDYQVKYLGTYRTFNLDENRDADASAIIAGPLNTGGMEDTWTTQHELRLTSPLLDKFDYIAGLFYYHSSLDREAADTRCFNLNAAKTVIDPVTLRVTNCNGTGKPINRDRSFTNGIDTDNAALFGEINYYPVEKLKLFAGARYLYEKTAADYLGIDGANRRTFNDSADDTQLIGRTGAQYFVTDDLNVFGSFSTGYKGSSWDLRIVSDATTFPTDLLKPEKSRQFEAGLRSQWLDRRITVNATAFEIKIDDFQEDVTTFVDTDGDGVIDDTLRDVVNAGQVRSRGVELETNFRVTRDLRFNASGAYTDTIYSQFADYYLPCPDPLIGTAECFTFEGAPYINLEGRRPPRSPKWQFNIGTDYTTEVADSGFELLLNATYRWRSEFNFSVDQDPRLIQGAYGVVDLSAGLRSPDGDYQLTLYAKNLFDKRYYSSAIVKSADFGGGVRAALPRDALRYFGGSLKINF